MSNIIDKIRLSGVTYTLSATSAGGSPTVELTQAEYDALVSAGTVSANTYYIITDAQSPDITQYWTSAQTQSAITQAVSGKVDTSSVVSSVTSASTDNEIPTAKAVWEAASGGGGTTYTAGRGIDITNDTISLSLPISAGTGSNSLVIASDSYGLSNRATVNGAVALNGSGYHPTSATGINSLAEGEDTKAAAYASHAEGKSTHAMANYSHAEGQYTIANNVSEHASGKYNVSNTGSTDADKTLFSVGNGTSNNARHNAFEIRQNGDMYLNNGTSDVKLQDYLQIKVVKLTQQEYDALTTKDNNTLYVIT